MDNYRLLIINPGSTSTKVAVYEGAKRKGSSADALTEIYMDNIGHSAEDLAAYATVMDQLPYRRELVLKSLAAHGIAVNSLDAIVARGGLLPPIKAGAYAVNDDLVWQLRHKPDHEHASNLAAVIADSIGRPLAIPSYIYDGVTVDEMEPVLTLTGLKEMRRKGMGHNLNMRAVAIRYAQEHGKTYADVNVIVAHLGGGISVSLHHGGRVADIINDETGPFSPERAGALPIFQLIHLAYSGQYSEKELMKIVKTQGGLMAHCGTTDSREVEGMIQNGDEKAKLAYEAMALNVAKAICSEAAIVKGAVDAVILTGGIAYSSLFVSMVKEAVAFIAPVIVYAGENEMQALAGGGYRVLLGQEEARTFTRV